MLLSLFIPLWSLQWTNAASNNHDPKRFKMLLTFGLRGAGSGRGSELVWFGLESGEVEEGWCCTFDACAVVTCLNRGTDQLLEARKLHPLTEETIHRVKYSAAGYETLQCWFSSLLYSQSLPDAVGCGVGWCWSRCSGACSAGWPAWAVRCPSGAGKCLQVNREISAWIPQAQTQQPSQWAPSVHGPAFPPPPKQQE